jgi:predicted transcriptional regulator
MGSDPQAGEEVRETVSKRSDVLASVRQAPAHKPELVDRLDVSRSTVNRAVDSLVETGMIRRGDAGYEITAHGELVLDAHEEYVATTTALGGAAPLLETLPAGETVPRSLIEDGVVRLAESHAPENALMEPIERLETAERLSVFSAVIKPSYLDLVQTEVEDSGLEADLVLGERATESLASLAGAIGTADELLGAPEVSVYTTDADLPFTLFVAPETGVAGIMTHREGRLVGSLTADADAAVDWARDRFESARENAEPVDGSELS